MNYQKVIYGNYPQSNYPEKLGCHLIHEYYKRINSTLNFRNKKVLDVGCGDGTYVKVFSNYFPESVGVDNDHTIKRLERNFIVSHNTNINFESDKLPFDNNSFDLIFTKSVIEHVRNTDHFLKEINRVLKPKGLLIILTPSWEHNWKDFYNDYTHVKPFHRKGLQDALKINDFTDVEVKYFYHLPWLWDRSFLLPIAKFLSLFSFMKWKNKEENIHRPNIRFSQEIQLIGTAKKNENT